MPAGSRQVAGHFPASTSEVASLSSVGDHVTLGDSPTSTLDEAARNTASGTTSGSAERVSVEILQALKRLKSCARSARLTLWREQFKASKQLAFSDSENLHREIVRKLISHLGHIDEPLDEPEARQLFKDAALAYRRDTDNALQAALYKELDGLGYVEKKLFILNFTPVLRFAFLIQQHLFFTSLYQVAREMGHSETLLFGETEEDHVDPDDPRAFGVLRAIASNAQHTRDCMTWLLTGTNPFPTQQWKRQLIADWKPYPQRPSASAFIASRHHTLSDDQYR